MSFQIYEISSHSDRTEEEEEEGNPPTAAAIFPNFVVSTDGQISLQLSWEDFFLGKARGEHEGGGSVTDGKNNMRGDSMCSVDFVYKLFSGQTENNQINVVIVVKIAKKSVK